MEKLLRVIISTVITLVILIIVALVILVNVINPNDFKDKISHMVYQQTGRQLTIDGKLHWTLFPWLSIKVNNAALDNAAGFAEKKFVAIGEADIRIKLIPLITGHIKAGKIILKNSNLYLTINKSGMNNWQDLIAPQKSHQSQNILPSSNSNKTKANITHQPPTSKSFSIDGINIENTNIYFNNLKTGQAATLKNIYLHTTNIQEGSFFKVNGKFDFITHNPSHSGNLKLQGNISFNLNKEYYRLNNLIIAGNIKPQKNVKNIAFKLKGDAIADLKQQTFNLNNFNLQANGLNMHGNINAKNIQSHPDYNGSLTVDKFNPRNLLTAANINLADNKALQSVSLQTKFSTKDKIVNIDPVVINIDSSKLQGKASVNIPATTVNFALNIDKFNLDRYTTTTAKTTKAAKKSSAPVSSNSKQTTTVEKTKKPSPWKVNGVLKVGNLVVNKLRLQNFTSQINYVNNILQLQKTQAKLYGGTLSGTTKVNFSSNTPSYALNTNLSAVQIQPLLKDLVGFSKVTGTAYFKARLTMHGKDSNSMLKSLNGLGNIAIRNGVFKGFDVRYQLRKIGAMLKRKPMPNITDTKQTLFGELTGTFMIRKGLLNNHDLKVKARDFQVTGAGTANLVNQRLNYQVKAANILGNKVEHIFLPIRITGTFSRPHFAPDFHYALQHFAKTALKNIVSGTIKGVTSGGKNLGKSLGVQINKGLGIKLF